MLGRRGEVLHRVLPGTGACCCLRLGCGEYTRRGRGAQMAPGGVADGGMDAASTNGAKVDTGAIIETLVQTQRPPFWVSIVGTSGVELSPACLAPSAINSLNFGPHTRHEPVGRRVATIDLRIACVRPQGRTRDHRGRQWGDRRVASCSRRLPAADRGAGSLRRAGACGVSRLRAGTGEQLRHRDRDGAQRTGTRGQAGAGGQPIWWASARRRPW